MSLLSNVSATVIQGQQVVGKQVSAENLGVSGILSVTGDVVLSSANLLNDSGIVVVSLAAAGIYTVLDGVNNIVNQSTGNVNFVLPSPSLNKGRVLNIKNMAAFSITSSDALGASVSNVVPYNVVVPTPPATTGAISTILAAATAGPPIIPLRTTLVSNGTVWVITAQ